MRPTRLVLVLCSLVALLVTTTAANAKPSPKQIIDKMLEHDFWGFSGAKVKAKVILKDKNGRKRVLAFRAISRKYSGYLTKSLLHFRAPPDLAGTSFLQVQKASSDDDRYLYLPALKRVKRVAAGQRSGAFVGTDFTFADLDRRDYRQASYKAGADGKYAGKYPCYRIIVSPKRRDSPYSKYDVLVQKKNFIPMQIKLYDKAGVHVKTLAVMQIKKIKGRWFVTKSRMKNKKERHTTTLKFSKIEPRSDIPDGRFTKRALKP